MAKSESGKGKPKAVKRTKTAITAVGTKHSPNGELDQDYAIEKMTARLLGTRQGPKGDLDRLLAKFTSYLPNT